MEKFIYEIKPYACALGSTVMLYRSSGGDLLMRGSCLLLLVMSAYILYLRWRARGVFN
jgi:hypothetical protein